MSSLKYWVWLSSASGVGAVTAGILLRRFGSPDKVFFARDEDYRGIEGIKPNDIKLLTRKNIGISNKILADCEEKGYRVITLQDAEYPERLRNIYDPPIVLYVRGRLPVIDEEAAVAVVGTRDCTPYGVSKAEDFAYRLARHGMLVVSGLAEGIDSAAAVGALRGGGRVLGIIGSGLDVVYLPKNKQLFEDVASTGAIISEYPPGTPAIGAHFPVRNRLLSGVSLGVAVIEAPRHSGALITASRALDQGRDVFTMPGNVDAPMSAGTNGLLKECATPLLSADDIINEYAELFPDKIIRDRNPRITPLDKRNTKRLVEKHAAVKEDDEDKKVIDNTPAVEYIDIDKILNALCGDERAAAEAIGTDTLHSDEITARTGLPAPRVMTALTMLELGGHAVKSGGSYFSLKAARPE